MKNVLRVGLLVLLTGLLATALTAAPTNRTSPGTDIFVPAAAHAPGGGGTYWQTDVRVFSPGAMRDTTVTVYLFHENQANPDAVYETVVIPAGQVLTLNDVIVDVFGYGMEDSVAGALRLTADSPLVVASTTYTTDATSGYKYGQGIPGVPAENVLKPTARNTPYTDFVFIDYVGGVSRTNLGLLDTSGEGSTVMIEFFGSAGVLRETLTVNLGAFEVFKKNIMQEWGITGEDIRARVTWQAGSGTAYTSYVRQAGGDTIYTDGTNVTPGGGDCPNPCGPECCDECPGGTGECEGWLQGGIFAWVSDWEDWQGDGAAEWFVQDGKVHAINTYYWIISDYLYGWAWGVRPEETPNAWPVITPFDLPAAGEELSKTLTFKEVSSSNPETTCSYKLDYDFLGITDCGWYWEMAELMSCTGGWSVLSGVNRPYFGAFGNWGDEPSIFYW